MNPDQQGNIDAMMRALAETLFSAWSHFHLLRGLHMGGRKHPVVLEQFGRLFDQTWRAAFDGLFGKVGTLLDRTRGNASLPNLITLVRKYGGSDLKQLLPEMEARLTERDSPLAKIKRWRHEVVAHRTRSGHDSVFYVDNKMNLDDLEGALVQLEELLNHVSLAVLNVHNDTRTGSEDLIEQGVALFACLGAQVSVDAATRPGVQ